MTHLDDTYEGTGEHDGLVIAAAERLRYLGVALRFRVSSHFLSSARIGDDCQRKIRRLEIGN